MAKTDELPRIPRPVNPAVPAALARAAAEDAKPLERIPLKRPGLGRKKADGRRSGGTFSLKVLVVATADNIGEEKEQPVILDRKLCRELCVPLHMEPKDYPTLRDDEAVMEEYEQPYVTEEARDRQLGKQVDPQTGDSLGFGPYDPAKKGNSDPHAGQAKWVAQPSVLVS